MVDLITPFFQHIKIIDVVDIAIITVFIYLILSWLKKARVRFIFIGIVMLGALYILARFFGLYLTTVALQAFFAVALIMIAIIFQDDLRHLFERMAVFGVTRRHVAKKPLMQNIEILASALANLSRKKIGALIVIKGVDPLERHLEAGVIVDAVISQVLLESIFDRHVPSHDGAVIVDGSRIAKLGCHLPLSTNMSEVGRLGTRHAAALGITERTDALSLVVSEEEGTISVSEAGRLKNLKDIAQLNHALYEFYNRKFPEKGDLGFKRFLMNSLPQAALAVVVACSLWVAFAHRTENVRRDYVIPIEYRNLAVDRIVNEPKAKEVTVTLSGNEQEFNLLRPREMKLSLDMSGIKDGKNKIPLTKDLVRNCYGLLVVNIEPSVISLESYRLLPLTVPIELKTVGKPPSGILIRSIRAEPKTIQVIVPATARQDNIGVATEPIDLSSLRETTTVTPNLVIPSDIRFPQDKRPEIKVFIEVEKKEKSE